jgi:hypothetical protein
MGNEPNPPALAGAQPWDRAAGEGDSAFAAFVAYRDLPRGSRSMESAANERRKGGAKASLSVFEKFSRKWAWQARVLAYDRWVDRQVKASEIEAIKEMRRRHINMAMSFQGAAALALNKIIQAEKSGAQLTLKPSEVRDLAELGLKVERLNRGEPEAIVEERVVPDAEPSGPVQQSYAKLSREELIALRGLVDKARGE